MFYLDITSSEVALAGSMSCACPADLSPTAARVLSLPAPEGRLPEQRLPEQPELPLGWLSEPPSLRLEAGPECLCTQQELNMLHTLLAFSPSPETRHNEQLTSEHLIY